jgi:hypothetical protein
MSPYLPFNSPAICADRQVRTLKSILNGRSNLTKPLRIRGVTISLTPLLPHLFSLAAMNCSLWRCRVILGFPRARGRAYMEEKSATSQPNSQSSGGGWVNNNHPRHPRVRARQRAQFTAARRSKRLRSEPLRLQRRHVEHSDDHLASDVATLPGFTPSACVHQVLAELHAVDQKLTGDTK